MFTEVNEIEDEARGSFHDTTILSQEIKILFEKELHELGKHPVQVRSITHLNIISLQ